MSRAFDAVDPSRFDSMHEVKPMRRFLTSPLILVAGLAVLLSGCSGESPTAPSNPGGGTGGPCSVSITLNATSVTPLAGSFVVVRATVKRNGAAVPDGTSVIFTTDLGFFLESGLPTVSKVTVSGFADVSLASLGVGAAHVKANLDCGTGPLTVEFQPVPANGPFISSIFPNSGSCLGGDTVTINGGRFGTDVTLIRVTFGGAPAAISTASDNQIVVRTPARTLQNPQTPEVVDVVVTVNAGTAGAQNITVTGGFTYNCVNPNARVFISSVVPSSGSPDGGETVNINGGHFGTNIATTRVTFCGVSATISIQADNQITVLTPRHTLANPAVSEVCDVGVTVDLGLASQQSAVLPRGFTYRGTGTGGACNTDPSLFISAVTPNSASPDGGASVTITGGGFPTSAANLRVEFGGQAAQVVTTATNAIIVTVPTHTLANPDVGEKVDVVVTRDVGGPSQACARLANGFTYRGAGPSECRTSAGTFISTITPNTGGPEGGTSVTITGGGFGATAATTRVEFGGVAGQVTTVTATSIVVTTPARTLADPQVPETVPVRVVIDTGGANQVCATQPSGFTYTRLALQPVITSTSPRTGPNDQSTRVTIFGTGFQFPLQVLLGGGACGSALIEAPVVSISLEQVVFLTPIATNGNTCLANSSVDIQVLNPKTGLSAVCRDCFRYYPCPSVTNVTPALVPFGQASTLIINGQNFEEPVTATVTVGGVTTNVNVTAVSSSGVTVQVPAIDPLASGGTTGSCTNIPASIQLTFSTLKCTVESVPFSYQVNPVTTVNATPTQLTQEGATAGSGTGAAPATITVTGTNFQDPMTVVLLNSAGVALTYTKVNNAQVSSPTTLSFPAPAIRDADMNTQACALAGNVIGTKLVPTSFSIRVTNARTGCTSTLPNVLVYNPNDTACHAAAAITTTSLPNATLCVPYGPVTLQGIGGTAPYTWTAVGLPAGLTLDPSTGTITGTPTLAAAGAGAANTVLNVAVTLTDSSSPPTTATRSYSISLTDPGAPFTITGQTTQNIGASGGTTSAFTAAPNAFPPITWSIDSITPPVPGITLTTTTGPSTQINVAGAVPGGTYTVTLRATDASCGTNHHTSTFQATVIKTPGSLLITSGALTSGTLCTPYSFQLTASGGTPPYNFSASPLPSGLTVNSSTGVISGTPTLAATGPGGNTNTSVTITVTDSSAAPQSVSTSQNLSITDPNGPFTISGSASQSIPAGGGTGTLLTANPNPTPTGFTPINWTIESIAPNTPGITLSSASGQATALTFASTVPSGTYTVIVRATDTPTAAGGGGGGGGGGTACGTNHHTATFTVSVNNAGSPMITSPDTLTLPAATLCQSYGPVTLTATGGTGPYSWSATGLPTGLALNPIGQTAQITGTPTLDSTGVGGNLTDTVKITVTDSSNPALTATRTYTLGVSDPDGPFVITGPGSVSFPVTAVAVSDPPFAAMVNKATQQTPTWTPIYWSLAGSVPAGITIVGDQGGTPTSGLTATLHADGTTPVGQYNVTIEAIDSPPCLSPTNPGVHHVADYTVILTITGP